MSLTKQELDKQKRIKFLRDNEEEVRAAFTDTNKAGDIVRKAMREGVFSSRSTIEITIDKMKNVAKRHIGWTI